jgi:hypothetical protein
MEMVINAYALNVNAEEAIAPRLSMVGRLFRTIGRAAVPPHVLAITKISLDEENAGV